MCIQQLSYTFFIRSQPNTHLTINTLYKYNINSFYLDWSGLNIIIIKYLNMSLSFTLSINEKVK